MRSHFDRHNIELRMKLTNMSREKFREEVTVPKKRIICWGAGKNAQKCIEELGIQENIDYFIDSDSQKWEQHYDNWMIHSPEKLMGEKDVILLVTNKDYYIILEKILERNYKCEGQILVYELMQDYPCDIDSIEDVWYFLRMIQPSIIRYTQNLIDEKLDEETIHTMVRKRGEKLGTKIDGVYPLVLPRIVLLVTNRCTLNCEGCCAFIDKFDTPQHMDCDKLIGGMKKIFSNIDGCINVQVAGGEAFLYPQLKAVLQYLLQEEKCEKIGIITNGTIVPNEEILKLLSNDKIFIEMSDYGLIEIQAKVISKFEENNIHFRVFCEQTWIDFGDPEIKSNKSMSLIKNQYIRCAESQKCKPFDGERIYACGRAARMHYINVNGYDYLHDSVKIEDGNIKQNILACYLMDYAEACDYCALMDKGAKRIPVGIQPNRKLRKSGYTIVSREEIARLRGEKA